MKIYLVKKRGGLTKIGITADFPRRMGEIRRRHKTARRWLVLSLWKAKEFEAFLHKKYDHLRVIQKDARGEEREWFAVWAVRPAFWILLWWFWQRFLVLLIILLIIIPYIYILWK